MAADLQKTIDIVFGAQDSGLKSNITEISSAFTLLDAGVHGVTGPIADATTSLLKTEAAIVATSLALTGLAINFAGDFSSSVEEVGSLLNLNAEQNAALAQTLLDYSRDASVGLNDIVEASYIAISTGTDLADVTTTLAAAEQLAVAGATDLNTATGALSRTMNSYGFEASEAERVSNALFIAVQNGDTTMEQLAGAIGRVASIASASNVPVEDLLASIAAITVAGTNTNETVTLLNSLFKELASPTTELATALGGMSLETNSLQEIMGALQDNTGGSFVEMNKLFGSIEATKAAIILANDTTGSFSNTLQAMETDTQNLSQAYELMADGFNRINQNLVNNIKATLIDAGIPLLDEYGSSVRALSEVFKGLSDGIDAPNFDAVYAALEDFISEFTVTLDGIANALPDALARLDLTGLTNSFGELQNTVVGVFDAIFGENLDLTKPEDLAQALQKVVNGISVLTQITSAVIKEFGPIFEAIGETLSRVSGLDQETLEIVGQMGALAIQVEQFGILMTVALKSINEAGANIGDVFNVIIGAGKAAINAFQIAFDGLAHAIFQIVANTFEDLDSFVPDFLKVEIFKDQQQEFQLLADAAAANLVSNFEDMEAAGRQMNSGLSGEMGKAAESVSNIGDKSQQAASEVSGASADMQQAVQQLPQLWGGVESALDDYIQALDNYGGSTDDAANKTEKLKRAADGTAPAFKDIQDAADAADGSVNGFVQSLEDGVPAYQQTQTGLAKANKEITNTETEAEKAAKKVDELEKTMLELASNERIASMEFTAEIETAKIEAQAKQVEAAFEAVASSVESTAQATTDLFALFASDGLSLRQALIIEKAAERQQDLQEDALKIQEKLTDAQIKLMNAQANNLNNGDKVIKIEADGLPPHIQAFMFEILKEIRVAASADYASFLLGT